MKSIEEGFEIRTLSNDRLSLSMAPRLGGRIVSLYDKLAGKEWLDGWRLESGRRLWEPDDPESYETGPGAGIDECLPTVLPCELNGQPLPDHGELWRTPVTLDETGLEQGYLNCSWSLRSLPLELSRSVSLEGTAIRFAYELSNKAPDATPFQWAWHPLFTLEPGDAIKFEEELTHCFTPDGARQSWPDALPGQDLAKAKLANADPSCAKVFVGPLRKPNVTICSNKSVLAMNWDANWFPWAGIWINGGVWKGLYHWAIEPTNVPRDRLSDGESGSALSTLAPGERRSWEVEVRICPPS